MRMLALAFVVAAAGFAHATPASPAALDCAQCRAVCTASKVHYPDDLKPDANENIVHASKGAEAAFVDGKKRDPAFGGKDAYGAIASYKKAVELDGNNAVYRNHLAGVLLSVGFHREAITHLEVAMRLVPSDAKYVVNLGYGYHKGGDEVRALFYYTRALMIDPADVRARLFLGYALEMLSYPREAELEFRKVLLQDPTNRFARAAIANYDAASQRATTTAAPPPLLNVSPTQECRDSKGTKVCGFGCVRGTDGIVACAQTPQGICTVRADGKAACSEPNPAPVFTKGRIGDGCKSAQECDTGLRCGPRADGVSICQ